MDVSTKPEGKSLQDLVPAPSGDRPLTPAQENFRTLIAKVESLRVEIDAEEAGLDASLTFYTTEIVPRLVRQATLQKEMVRALAPFLTPKFFPRKHERLEIGRAHV